jgi:hypothetical protein
MKKEARPNWLKQRYCRQLRSVEDRYHKEVIGEPRFPELTLKTLLKWDLIGRTKSHE